MGRPLKIAKAQAVLTLTDTTASTDEITVSQSAISDSPYFILPGMTFVVASSVGGLTAGTIYWILEVTGDSTFTASATPPDANVYQTPVALSDTTGGSVAVSVGVVDAYFNNPATGTGYPADSSTTYGVVGGNTSIYGKQVLAQIAISQTGTGTVFATTGSNVVVGLGTDFASLTTGTKIFAVWGAGAGPTQLLGTATSTKGNLLVAVANTAASGNVIGATGNTLTLTLDTPVTFDASFGGLTSGTTYYVKTIPSSSTFTVSPDRGGAPVQLTNSTTTANAIQNRVVLAAGSANDAIGVSGTGDPFVTAFPENGFILRQKGKTKYLVQGLTSGLIGACYTANTSGSSLQPGEMTLTANTGSADRYVQSLSDINAELFAGDGSLGQSNAVFATFNAAESADEANGIPYPIVTITGQ